MNTFHVVPQRGRLLATAITKIKKATKCQELKSIPTYVMLLPRGASQGGKHRPGRSVFKTSVSLSRNRDRNMSITVPGLPLSAQTFPLPTHSVF
jgi:hypothetical protein